MSNDRFLDPAVKAKVIEAYERGDKIRDIELAHDVPRSTVYWILEQAELSPNRAQRGRRLAGNDQQLANLYDLITAQDKRIKELSEASTVCVDFIRQRLDDIEANLTKSLRSKPQWRELREKLDELMAIYEIS